MEIDTAYFLAHNWWDRVDVGQPDECWLWQQSTGSHGYGQTWDGRTVLLAHRVAWTLTNGPIPNTMTIDHICRTRRCCNPTHLRLLPNVENAKDNANARRTHCLRGHAFDGDNLYIVPSTGHRRCRTCNRLRERTRSHDHDANRVRPEGRP